MLVLEWTGTLSTIFEDPAVPEYESDITVIDAIDNMLFLRVDITTREPWKNVLKNQGYERSEMKDVVLWMGPPPWEAFAFGGHNLIVSNTESNITELLERRFTGGASFYDIAGDLFESLLSIRSHNCSGVGKGRPAALKQAKVYTHQGVNRDDVYQPWVGSKLKPLIN